MRSGTAVRLAWLLFGVVACAFAGDLVFAVLNAGGPDPVPAGETVASTLMYLEWFAFAVAGVLIATRQPRNPVGWLLLAIGLVWEIPTEGYVRYAYVTAPGSLPAADLVAVLSSSSWVPGIGLIGTYLLLLFPDGRLPSPRWRPVAWASGVALAVNTVVIPILPLSLREVAAYPFVPDVPNPYGVEALAPVADVILALVLALPLCIAACAVSLVVRFRRSDGQQRMQLKWLAAAAGVCAAVYAGTMVLSVMFGGATWDDSLTPDWLAVLQRAAIFAFVLIPVAVGIAILRHRLYDIDLIIRRTLVYAGLTALLAAVYGGCVIAVGALLQAVSGRTDSNLTVAVSTLAVAALFAPLRRRVQSFIDRRFYRRRYDAQQTLAAFAAGLRNEVDLSRVQDDLVGVVTRSMQPAVVSLWVRPLRTRS